MRIHYLFNSGFLVELNKTWLIFDDCDDPADVVRTRLAAESDVHLYIFVSHAHFDHFDPRILDYAPRTEKYIFSRNVRHTKRARKFPADKTIYLEDYSTWQDGTIAVQTFSSTDVGTSFLVEADGRKIFHAGDFNWWHWTGDTAENQTLMKNAFMKQMKKLRGLSADVAFFPTDGRLEEARDMGVNAFCADTDIRALVTMHNVGYAPWQPSADFPRQGLPYFSPAQPGEVWELK